MSSLGAAEVQLLTSLTQLLSTVVLPPDPLNCGRRHERGLLGSCSDPDDIQKRFQLRNSNTTEAWFGEFPWLASVRGAPPGRNALSVCSGALVHPQAVLVSGACYNEAAGRDWKLTVRLAEFRIDSDVDFGRSPQDFEISSVVHHPEFVRADESVANDVALVFLDRPATLEDDVDVVCMPWWASLQRQDTLSEDWEKRECVLAGWSDPRKTLGDGVYHEKVKFLSRETCQKRMRKLRRLGPFQELHRSFACAEPETDCWADIGSSLVCRNSRVTDRWTLVGMVPYSRLYQQCDDAVSYTNVGMFADWISSAITAQLSVTA